MPKLKLHRPITIDDQEIKEIEYDLEALSGLDFIAAKKEVEKKGHAVLVQETDSAFHAALFARATQPKIHVDDIVRLGAKDFNAMCSAVRSFFISEPEDGQE